MIPSPSDRTIQVLGGLLSLSGILVTGWLLRFHLGFVGVCTSGGGCEQVLTSSWARIGTFPTALYGLVFYVGWFVTWNLWPLIQPTSRWIVSAALVTTTCGVFLGSAGLTAYSIVQLETLCFLCTISLILVTCLLVLSVLSFKQEPDSPVT